MGRVWYSLPSASTICPNNIYPPKTPFFKGPFTYTFLLFTNNRLANSKRRDDVRDQRKPPTASRGDCACGRVQHLAAVPRTSVICDPAVRDRLCIDELGYGEVRLPIRSPPVSPVAPSSVPVIPNHDLPRTRPLVSQSYDDWKEKKDNWLTVTPASAEPHCEVPCEAGIGFTGTNTTTRNQDEWPTRRRRRRQPMGDP